MDRVSTGIKGLDEVLEGGFPRSSVVTIVGEPGTGKTTFVMQYLFKALKCEESGLYITAISEDFLNVNRFMSTYSFYNEELISLNPKPTPDKPMITFRDIGRGLVEDINLDNEDPQSRIQEMIAHEIAKGDYKHLVIDPLTPFSHIFNSSNEYRKFLQTLFMTLKTFGVTTLLTTEAPPENAIRDEFYLSDGVIALYLRESQLPEIFKPALQVKKMRGTNHTKDILKMGISKDGMMLL